MNKILHESNKILQIYTLNCIFWTRQQWHPSEPYKSTQKLLVYTQQPPNEQNISNMSTYLKISRLLRDNLDITACDIWTEPCIQVSWSALCKSKRAMSHCQCHIFVIKYWNTEIISMGLWTAYCCSIKAIIDSISHNVSANITRHHQSYLMTYSEYVGWPPSNTNANFPTGRTPYIQKGLIHQTNNDDNNIK